MLTRLKNFIVTFLYDEAAFQRYSAVALFALGGLIASGGVIPGTEVVVPIADLIPSKWGAPLTYLGLYLGAGGGLPGQKNGAPKS